MHTLLGNIAISTSNFLCRAKNNHKNVLSLFQNTFLICEMYYVPCGITLHYHGYGWSVHAYSHILTDVLYYIIM